MAISKEILNNKKKKANQPEPLGTIPRNNPEHVSSPADFHHPIPPKPILYNSFKEAKDACELIFLKPGEAHTEFYQKDGEYHCVIAIGNIKPNTEHLYLTDSGNEMSIDDKLDNMTEYIDHLSKLFSALSEKFDNLSDNVEEFENNVSTALNQIKTDIRNFENNVVQLVNQINTSINIFSEKVEDLSIFVDGFNERILQNTDDVSALTNKVIKIENWKPVVDISIIQLENKTKLIDSSLEELQIKDLEIDNSIGKLKEKISQIDSSLEELKDKNILTDSSIIELRNKDIQIDSSIIKLQDLINDFEPIDTSSIRSLFHDDIWTVNLCCYTAGGHVEIFDNVAGEKCGGNDPRVAECTPFNEYKTYINGDDVSFMAVANEGYKFVRWYENGNEYADTSIISLAFNNSDIPVIGTLNTEVEPKILNFGYTALFKKLHKLNCKINQFINDEDASTLTYFDDIIKVIIKDVGENPVEYIIDKDFNKTLYFDDDASIHIIAIPSQQGHHTFEGFIINGSEEIYEAEVKINHNNKDISILAKFEEWWIKVTADASPSYYGEINYQPGYYLFNTSTSLKAIPNRGYIFTNWAGENISDEELQNNIIIGNLSTPDISLYINNNIDEYEIRADFDIKKCTVIFYNSDDSIIDRSIVNFGTSFGQCKPTNPEDPEHQPPYNFIGWTIKGKDEIIVDEYIIESDTEFKAKYENL